MLRQLRRLRWDLDTEIVWDAASVHVPRLPDAARRLQAAAASEDGDAEAGDKGAE
jgi:hypothetical protein